MGEPTKIAEAVPEGLRERAYARSKLPPKPEPEEPDYQAELEAERNARWPHVAPARFVNAKVEDLSLDLRKLATRWEDTGFTSNVLLLGSVGVGKTHAAVAMARRAFETGRRMRFVPVVELLDAMRPGGDPVAFDRAVEVDVLVLDDLGGERPTDWSGERLYALINRRWLEERATVATSNLDASKLESAVGARVWSRLYHDALRLKIGGEDRRRAA
jgi:DNA replication protein DnaC